MRRYVLELEEIDRSQIAIAGGKGAHLGELTRVDGIRVPDGFCMTTGAFDRVTADTPLIADLLDRLSRVQSDDPGAIRALATQLRRILEETAIPDDVSTAITAALTRTGEELPYAVRSSATAEDLPTASFAGQHDTYLNVVGPPQIRKHIRRCWASLFTERAISYRMHNGIDHRKVRMAVVVQQMVEAAASGVLFTADPVSGHRRVSSIEPVIGLGDALVSGQVNPDSYQVRDDAVVLRAEQQERPALSDAQLIQLSQLGRQIEAHFGCPQDIEWCLSDNEFSIVQSRPITTLYPIPETDEQGTRVYLSVGHQQMMTDAMKPLGLSMWRLTTPAPAREAGGRLFVDATRLLSSPATRASFVKGWGQADPLVGDALQTIIDRPGFLPTLTEDAAASPPAATEAAALETDRAIVLELIKHSEASLAQLKRDIEDHGRCSPNRLYPQRHPGASADPLRPTKPSGIHVGDGDQLAARRTIGGVTRREERGRHAHAIGRRQRHLRNGSGPAGRR